MQNVKLLVLIFIASIEIGCDRKQSENFQTIRVEVLKDKIAGGWAGKMIGVTYGAPTEFVYRKKINEDTIRWTPADIRSSLTQDDLYVQLAILSAMDKSGVDVSAKEVQETLAKAGFTLWAANLQARKNYFNGIYPPASGGPEYNYRADDIDFQIESDFIGFLNPGMLQNDIEMSDKIGHIMNYGDGVYGGTFVAAMHSAAFFENDILKVVEKGLSAIPSESNYAKIINDVIKLYKEYPDNWRLAWKELDDKWSEIDISGASIDFNFDATLNGAYIVMGLLYGKGDVLKTLEISTRCGQDSDCNPANALAVLGVIKGFSNLPAEMTNEIIQIADSNFVNTSYSFNKVVESTFKYADQIIKKNGGFTKENIISIPVQNITLHKLEVSFPNVVYDTVISIFAKENWKFKGNWQIWQVPHWEKNHRPIDQSMYASKKGDELEFTFEGSGVALYGNIYKYGGKADFYVDDKLYQTLDTYYYYCKQEPLDICIWHVFRLEEGKHTVRVVVRGEKRKESSGTNICVTRAFIYKTGQKKNETYKFSFEKY
jgi:hypothetical protein